MVGVAVQWTHEEGGWLAGASQQLGTQKQPRSTDPSTHPTHLPTHPTRPTAHPPTCVIDRHRGGGAKQRTPAGARGVHQRDAVDDDADELCRQTGRAGQGRVGKGPASGGVREEQASEASGTCKSS